MEEKVILSFKRMNPWHTSSEGRAGLETLPSSIIPREALYTALQKMDTSFVLALEGPRRVGKSQLMRLLMQHLVKKQNVDPKQIFFVNCDDGTIQTPNLIDNLKSYVEEIFGRSFESIDEKIYFFLDEITLVEGWEKSLKLEIDGAKGHQYIVTSSSAIQLKLSKQNLVGRMATIHVLPFSFFEALELYRQKQERFLLSEPLYDTLNSMREQLRTTFLEGRLLDPERILKIPERIEASIIASSPDLRKECQNLLQYYLLEGGYPDFILKGDKFEDYFSESVLDGLIHKDIPAIFHLTKSSTEKVHRLVYRLLFENTKVIQINELQQEIGEAHHPRVGEYLHYLEASLIMDLLLPWHKTHASRSRKSKKKVFFIDSGLVNQVTGLLAKFRVQRGLSIPEFWQSQEKGSCAETMVYQHLRRLKYDWKVYYFRDQEKDGEKTADIDFVWETPFGLIPIESKMKKRDPDEATLNRMEKIRKELKAPYVLVITESHVSQPRKGIVCLPLLYFLGSENVQ